MPSIALHRRTARRESNVFSSSISSNPLPKLLQTPSGLAIVELQGTINMPTLEPPEPPEDSLHVESHETHIGRLVFPDYTSNATASAEDTSWMKRAYLYVGRHQRLTGEVKKLPSPMAVIRRRTIDPIDSMQIDEGQHSGVGDEELEIVEIVSWKILFSQRPEPVGGTN